LVKVVIENYNDKVVFQFKDIKIKINDCDDEQIKIYNKNGLLYCENPKCNPNCPVDISAYCKKYYNESINNPNLNICECLPGYNGIYCENKIFIDYR